MPNRKRPEVSKFRDNHDWGVVVRCDIFLRSRNLEIIIENLNQLCLDRSMCDDLVTTTMSTFGYVPAALSSAGIHSFLELVHDAGQRSQQLHAHASEPLSA